MATRTEEGHQVHEFVTQFWASTVTGLTVGSIYALVALGYTLVYGVLRLINFAHSEIFMIGTFAATGVIGLFGLDAPASGLTLVAVLLCAVVAAMLASGASAVVLERVAYRRLRTHGTSKLAALISAIGASLFLQELFATRFGRDPLYVERVLNRRHLFSIGTANVTVDRVLIVGAALALMVVLDRLVNATKLGRGIRATAQDSESAVLMGVDINRIVVTTFLLGGAMAGLAGALYVVYFERTNYLIGFVIGIKAFTAAVLGGIGNLRGALLGGIAIGLIENYGASFGFVGAQWKDVIVFSVLVLVLMFRPTGLLGESLGRARA